MQKDLGMVNLILFFLLSNIRPNELGRVTF
jgi:hypothetical protein